MNDKFEVETGKNFHKHVKDAIDNGNMRWKAEQTAEKEARLQSIKDQKAADAAERDAAREEAARKRAEQRAVLLNILYKLYC